MLDDRTTTFSWEEAAKDKTEKALALARRMVEWFAQNYEDPAESTPYCSEEGGYLCLCGEPCDARGEIEAHFADKQEAFSADEWDEIVTAAVDEVQEDGVTEWAKILPDDDPEPDDDVIRLLRAHDHYWGKGHVHRLVTNIGKTACGRKLENCLGDLDWGTADAITCKACLNTIERRGRP